MPQVFTELLNLNQSIQMLIQLGVLGVRHGEPVQVGLRYLLLLYALEFWIAWRFQRFPF